MKRFPKNGRRPTVGDVIALYYKTDDNPVIYRDVAEVNGTVMSIRSDMPLDKNNGTIRFAVVDRSYVGTGKYEFVKNPSTGTYEYNVPTEIETRSRSITYKYTGDYSKKEWSRYYFSDVESYTCTFLDTDEPGSFNESIYITANYSGVVNGWKPIDTNPTNPLISNGGVVLGLAGGTTPSAVSLVQTQILNNQHTSSFEVSPDGYLNPTYLITNSKYTRIRIFFNRSDNTITDESKSFITNRSIKQYIELSMDGGQTYSSTTEGLIDCFGETEKLGCIRAQLPPNMSGSPKMWRYRYSISVADSDDGVETYYSEWIVFTQDSLSTDTDNPSDDQPSDKKGDMYLYLYYIDDKGNKVGLSRTMETARSGAEKEWYIMADPIYYFDGWYNYSTNQAQHTLIQGTYIENRNIAPNSTTKPCFPMTYMGHPLFLGIENADDTLYYGNVSADGKTFTPSPSQISFTKGFANYNVMQFNMGKNMLAFTLDDGTYQGSGPGASHSNIANLVSKKDVNQYGLYVWLDNLNDAFTKTNGGYGYMFKGTFNFEKAYKRIESKDNTLGDVDVSYEAVDIKNSKGAIGVAVKAITNNVMEVQSLGKNNNVITPVDINMYKDTPLDQNHSMFQMDPYVRINHSAAISFQPASWTFPEGNKHLLLTTSLVITTNDGYFMLCPLRQEESYTSDVYASSISAEGYLWHWDRYQQTASGSGSDTIYHEPLCCFRNDANPDESIKNYCSYYSSGENANERIWYLFDKDPQGDETIYPALTLITNNSAQKNQHVYSKDLRNYIDKELTFWLIWSREVKSAKFNDYVGGGGGNFAHIHLSLGTMHIGRCEQIMKVKDGFKFMSELLYTKFDVRKS